MVVEMDFGYKDRNNHGWGWKLYDKEGKIGHGVGVGEERD